MRVPDGNRTWFSVILWWELRRVPYNLLMLIVATFPLAVLALILVTNPLPPDEDIGNPFISIILFALGANLAYTLGWMAELLSRRIWKEESRTLGPKFFTLGVIFSVFLCLCPGLIVFVFWLISLLRN